eukprot:Partr_v1_DN28945_c0_g1_i2_m24931 putative exportin 4
MQNPATRANAELQLMHFRQQESALVASKHILLHSVDPLVLFHAATAMRDASIRFFSLLDSHQVSELKDFLLNYIIQRPQLAGTVREQLFRAIAVIIKRSWLDDSVGDHKLLLTSVHQLMGIGGGEYLALRLAHALVVEFSSGKSSSVGLSLEFHARAKVSFQLELLRALLELALSVLVKFSSTSTTELSKAQDSTLAAAISVVEEVLSWDFADESRDLKELFADPAVAAAALMEFSSTASEHSAARKIPASWASLVMTPDFVDLFFNLYVSLGDHDDAHYRIGQCLLQLAAVTGPIFSSGVDSMVLYCRHFLTRVLHLFDILADPRVRLPIYQVARRLVENFRFAVIKDCSESARFIECIAANIKATVKLAHLEDDDDLNLESFDESLETWTLLTYQAVELPESDQARGMFLNAIRDPGFVMFCDYVASRVDTPLRDKNYQTDFDFSDQEIYDDQLISISMQARLNGVRSLQYINQIMNQRLEQFKFLLLDTHKLNMVQNNDLESIFEHLHWLLLFSGYVLADQAHGEKPLIPDCWLHEQSGAVVECVSNVFRLLDIYNEESERYGTGLLSPLVFESAFWFLERWCHSYLFYDCSGQYSTHNSSLEAAFGMKNGNATLEMSIRVIQIGLSKWTDDRDICEAIVDFISGLAANSHIAGRLMSLSSWLSSVAAIIQNIDRMPSDVHCDLIRCLSLMGSESVDHSIRQPYFTLLFQAIDNCYNQVVSPVNAPRGKMDLRKTQDVMDMFTGLSQSIKPPTIGITFGFLRTHLASFNNLLDRVELQPQIFFSALVFWNGLSANVPYEYLGDEDRAAMFGAYVEALTKFTYYQSHVTSDAREAVDLQDHILSILETMDYLLEGENETRPGAISAQDAVIHSLPGILPLITTDMLKVPDICEKFVALVFSICRLMPDKLVIVGDYMFQGLLQAIEFALNNATPSISSTAMNCLKKLCEFSLRSTAHDNLVRLHKGIDQLAGQFINHILFNRLDSELTSTIDSTFLILFKSRPQPTQQILQQVYEFIVKNFSTYQPRIDAEFKSLQAGIQNTFTSKSSTTTEDKELSRIFLRWLMNLKAIVCLK